MSDFGIPLNIMTESFDGVSNSNLFINPKGKIHVRFQKTGPRSITLIEGLDEDLDLKRISKAMKKVFKCSSCIQKDKDGNDVIQLQGNHCINVRDWLLAQEILTPTEIKERLVIHGF
jgi:translation initiation factor 1